MAVFVTKWFSRWARKEGLSDTLLCAAVAELTAGLFEADLGGGLYKKRIARPGQGKSGGFRTLIATNRASRWFFVYGFAKNQRSNIDDDEEEALKLYATQLLALSAAGIEKLVKAGAVKEVDCNG